MKCEETRERLSEFEAGELSPELAQGIREHLSRCGACSELLTSLSRMTGLMVSLTDEEPSRSLCVRVLARMDEMRAPGLDSAPEIMTPEDLALYLRIPYERVEEEIGDIPAFEIGGELRFRKERIREWIDRRERERQSRLVYSQLRAV